MNTIQLECFIAVAEHLNFSKASRALKITQPAVSHQIQSLEEELNVRLFSRTSKSVSLTPEGLLFLGDAQLILKTALSAKERLGRHEHFIAFETGCHDYPEMRLFPSVFNILCREYPLLRPNFHLIPFPSLFSMVENGQIHAALGIKEDQRKSVLRFRKLCSAPIACVCSPQHPLASYESLTKSELSGTFIACSPRQISDSVFKIQNHIIGSLSPEQRFLTENIESVFTLAKARIGYTLYPDIFQAREPDLCYIPVTDLPKVSFGIYCQYDDDRPVMKRFLALMADRVNQS